MSNISKVKLNETIYNLKDPESRAAIGSDTTGNLISVSDNIKNNAANADYSETQTIKEKIDEIATVTGKVYFESGDEPELLSEGGLFFKETDDDEYKPQIKESDTVMKDVKFNSSSITELKTVNGINIRGFGDITIEGQSQEKKTAELKYYRYLEESSSVVKPYAIELRNATLNMTEFSKLGTGLFIHWGVYSVPAGTYTGEKVPTATMTTTKMTRNCEWALRDLGIPLDVYKAYQDQFTGTNFDPEAIVQMAVDCGMKYIVITAKHHEGFSLYPTSYGSWDIRTSACRNTVIQELKDACDAAGLKFGIYYSQYWDWEAVGGYGLNHNNKWTTTDPYTAEQHTAFMTTVTNQINEIVEKYDPYILWYDPGTKYTDGCVTTLRNAENANWPQVITNNRLAYDRAYGDYGTGERTIYLGDLKYGETCFTLNNTWGYSQNNETESWYYSPEKLMKNFLLYTLSYGQNCLMNIGPKPDGSIPALTTSRWNSMKSFIQTYVPGKSFYGYNKMFTTTRPNWGYMIGMPDNKVLCFIIPNSDDDISDFILDGVDTSMLKENGVVIKTYGTTAPTYEIIDDYRIRIKDMTLDTSTNIGVVQLEYSDTPIKLDRVCVGANDKISTGIFPVLSSTYTLYDINKDKSSSPTTTRTYNMAASGNKTISGARMQWCGETGYYAVKTLAEYSANQNGTDITKVTLTNVADSTDVQTLTITCLSKTTKVVESSDAAHLVNGNIYTISYNVSGTDTNEFTQTGFTFISKTSALTGVSLASDVTEIDLNTSATLTATVTPENVGEYTLSWSVSPSTATITPGENNTAVLTYNSFDSETLTVTVTATDASTSVTDTKNIEYIVTPVTSITLSQETASVPYNTVDALELTATVSPSTAQFNSITWSSDNTSIATVDQNGKVTTLAAGPVNITATATDYPTISASCAVTVTQDEVIEIQTITTSSITLDLQECEIVELTATITPENATYPSLTWTSNNDNIIIVSQGSSNHTVKVVAKEGFAGTATITVVPTHTQTTYTPSVTVTVTSELETNTYMFEADSLDGNDSAILQDTNWYPFSDTETNWTLFAWAYGSVNPAAVSNATLFQCVVNASPWSGLRIDADNNAVKISSTIPAPLRPRMSGGSDLYFSMFLGELSGSSYHDASPQTAGLTVHPFYMSRKTDSSDASTSKYYWSFDGKNWTEFAAFNTTQVNRLKTCPLTVGYDYKRSSGTMTTERYRFLKTTGLADERVCVSYINQPQYKYSKRLKAYDLSVNNEYNNLVNATTLTDTE